MQLYVSVQGRFFKALMICLISAIGNDLAAIAAPLKAGDPCDPLGVLESRLACIEGLTFAEQTIVPRPAGYRVFDMM
ncbi:MAG: hypothetical protein NTV34_02450 [Proteobacteria bacterium]|nr:hypothetical protein [Pseudomonadota bacterium]